MAEKKVRFIFETFQKLSYCQLSGRRLKSFNSAEWLKRREMDIYVEKAKRENYRCRSAYKLIEIDDKYKLVKPGNKVLDVGAAPGSWSQVLAQRTNSNENDKNKPKGLVIAIDLTHIHPIEGVTIFSKQDFTCRSSQDQILNTLRGDKLDFVFSDMAPMATGIKSLDQDAIVKLVYPVLLFAVQNLNLNGGCLIKIWEGKHKEVGDLFKKFFKTNNFVKPNATYSSSSEIYLLGRHFIGVKKL